MKKTTFRRIGAYLIDIFVISMLISLISQINFVNPNRSKFIQTQNEFSEYYERELGNITAAEMDDIVNKEYASYMYDLQYYAMGDTIAEVLVIILYFTLFPYFNNDQSIGKRLFKIKVVSENNKKVKLWQYFVRSLFTPIVVSVIMYNVFSSIFNIIALFIFRNIKYMYANLIITYIVTIVCYIDILYAIRKKDNISLHDLISKTKVVEAC